MFCVMCGLGCVVWVIVDRRGAIGALVVLVAVREEDDGTTYTTCSIGVVYQRMCCK